MIKNLVLGIVVGFFFVFMSFESINLKGVATGLKAAKPFYLVFTLSILILIEASRSKLLGSSDCLVS